MLTKSVTFEIETPGMNIKLAKKALNGLKVKIQLKMLALKEGRSICVNFT